MRVELRIRDQSIGCPFVYANGKKCAGHIYRAVAYGPRGRDGSIPRDRVRKYRLHCSLRDDHCGIWSSFETKDRMEFYPDQLPEGVEDRLWGD